MKYISHGCMMCCETHSIKTGARILSCLMSFMLEALELMMTLRNAENIH